MDESGGSGQPRSGTEEPAVRQPDRTAPATGPTRPENRPIPTDQAVSPTPAPSPATPRPDAGAARPQASDRPAEGPSGTTPPGPADGGRSNGAVARHDDDGGRPDDTPAGSGDPGTGGGKPEPSPGPEPNSGTDRPTPPSAPAEGPAPEQPRGDQEGSKPPATGDHHPPRTPATGDAPTPAHPHTPVSGDKRSPSGAPDHGHTPAHRTLAHSTGEKGPAPQRPEPGGGLLMGRLFGVPVYVAPSWFLVAALITWVFGGQLDRVLPELGAARYLVSLFFAVAFYASVLVHELAHTVAALRFKLPVRRIQLQFFGGVSEIEKEAETPGREFVLAFVGPLLSLVLAGVFYVALQPVEPGTVPGVLLAGLMISNLIVAAFNLLPGLPLDGGRMLRAVVWKITGKPMTGTVAAAWVGRALAVSVLIGLPLLTQSGALGSDAVDNVGMDTVMDALLAAILAAIIWTGAGNSLRVARLREHLPELRARALTRRAVPVEGDTPLSEALRRANAAGARALVVVDADGNPVSLVREAAIVGVPEHRRPWVAVSGLAQELTGGMRVSAELAGEDLLEALRATPATEYLVVEETGEIYGVLSAADVERAFVKAMARPS
ncbi:site-2 protease family protein [Streptomyces cadmiisoli]|uniref:site-2 protease family protein n=1 Tax=Streptomyces cadmiisoli TaxID=2184053 RepID=UPI003647BCB8